MALLVALGVAASQFTIPLAGARLFPMQGAIDVLAGVMFGPVGAVVVALLISLLRNFLGLGTILAFPGSLFGAFLAGLAYRASGWDALAAVGEVVGTGLVGAIVSYPLAVLLLGRSALLFTYVVPFALSSLTGAIIGVLVLQALRRAHALPLDSRVRQPKTEGPDTLQA